MGVRNNFFFIVIKKMEDTLIGWFRAELFLIK